MQLVAEKMRAKKITPAELARLTGRSRSAVSLWLNGKRKPDYPSLVAISEAVEIPLARLARDFGYGG